MNLELLRYIMAGICTTFVNLGVFSILKYGVNMETQIANVVSILFAIAFAFVINKSFVFGQKSTENLRKQTLLFCQYADDFYGSRGIRHVWINRIKFCTGIGCKGYFTGCCNWN